MKFWRGNSLYVRPRHANPDLPFQPDRTGVFRLREETNRSCVPRLRRAADDVSVFYQRLVAHLSGRYSVDCGSVYVAPIRFLSILLARFVLALIGVMVVENDWTTSSLLVNFAHGRYTFPATCSQKKEAYYGRQRQEGQREGSET